MSLLTDQEIHAADPAPHERFDQERIALHHRSTRSSTGAGCRKTANTAPIMTFNATLPGGEAIRAE